jgi:hypothetical protein
MNCCRFLCNWIKVVNKIDLEKDVLQLNGIDYTVYLLYLRHTARFFLCFLLAGIGLGIFYLSGDKSGNQLETGQCIETAGFETEVDEAAHAACALDPLLCVLPSPLDDATVLNISCTPWKLWLIYFLAIFGGPAFSYWSIRKF